MRRPDADGPEAHRQAPTALRPWTLEDDLESLDLHEARSVREDLLKASRSPWGAWQHLLHAVSRIQAGRAPDGRWPQIDPLRMCPAGQADFAAHVIAVGVFAGIRSVPRSVEELEGVVNGLKAFGVLPKQDLPPYPMGEPDPAPVLIALRALAEFAPRAPVMPTPLAPGLATGKTSAAAPSSDVLPGSAEILVESESQETGQGSPRSNGRVVARVLRDGLPPRDVTMSPQILDSLRELEQKGEARFGKSEKLAKRSTRLEARLKEWQLGGSRDLKDGMWVVTCPLRLVVRSVDGTRDRGASVRRLKNEAVGEAIRDSARRRRRDR